MEFLELLDDPFQFLKRKEINVRSPSFLLREHFLKFIEVSGLTVFALCDNSFINHQLLSPAIRIVVIDKSLTPRLLETNLPLDIFLLKVLQRSCLEKS